MASLSAAEFIEKLSQDPSFRSKVGITTHNLPLDEFQSKAAAAGYNYTPEEIMAAGDVQKNIALTDQDLDQVTGGRLTIKITVTISW